jgi:hypothetical protein
MIRRDQVNPGLDDRAEHRFWFSVHRSIRRVDRV